MDGFAISRSSAMRGSLAWCRSATWSSTDLPSANMNTRRIYHDRLSQPYTSLCGHKIIAFPEVGGLHHRGWWSASSLRTSRRVMYCGDRIGGPVSAWGAVPFLQLYRSGAMASRTHAWCPSRSSDQCSIRLIKNRQSRSSSANGFQHAVERLDRDFDLTHATCVFT